MTRPWRPISPTSRAILDSDTVHGKNQICQSACLQSMELTFQRELSSLAVAVCAMNLATQPEVHTAVQGQDFGAGSQDHGTPIITKNQLHTLSHTRRFTEPLTTLGTHRNAHARDGQQTHVCPHSSDSRTLVLPPPHTGRTEPNAGDSEHDDERANERPR